MVEKTRIVLVDDHAMVREGIRHVLESADDIDVVGEASDADDAITVVRKHRPDIVLLDITLPGKTGLHVATTLREEMPDLKILILSMHDHAQYVVQAVKAGVHGYLLKDAGVTELRKAVAAIRNGIHYFSPGVINHLGAAVRRRDDDVFSAVDRLTDRERQVLVRIACGLTNKETANELGISTRTVETHRESLMRKVNVKTVAGLTRLALETGLLQD